MMRLDRKSKETSRTVGPLREEEVSRPSSTPVEDHAAFVASAQRVLGNRAVGAALRGESVDGPEAVLHAALAFGAAGISVGSDVRDVLSNSAIIRLLASAAPSVDGAPAPAPGASGFGGFGLDFSASGLASAGLGSVGLAASGFEGLGASGFDGGSASGFEGSAGVDRALARHPGRAGGGGRAPQLVERAARSGARPLPDSVRAEMEARFGERFADVVVHTDGAAQAAAEAVQARAYTVGNEIWFGRGEFRPGDPAGLELLAHELTHVLQNRGGDARSEGGETVNGMAVSSPGDARELEAFATARDVMRGPAPSLDGGLSPTMDLHADLGSSDSGMSVATGGGDMLSRDPDPEKPRKKKLKDGTAITIYSDGNGGYYLQSPEGDKLKCDKDGTPDEDALNKHSEKAEQKGNNSPRPAEPERTIPPETPPNTEKTKGDVKNPKGGGTEKVENPGGDGTGGTSTGESGMGTYPQLKFVVKFAEMCGMIPSRGTSAGQSASGRAKKIEDGVKGANDSGTTTKDKSEKDKQTVTKMKEVTKTATSDTTTATESLHAVSKSVDTAIVDTDVGSGELVSADAQISEKISTLEAKQGEERARHGTAVSTMSGWASDHEAKRAGQKTAAEKELEEIERKKAELAQKAEDGGGEGGTGGTLNPEMAGAMPASAPKRLDPSLLEGGTPMPSSVQSRMEKAFGQSFSGVEIHTGADGNQAAAGFNSKAFTFGSQVFFGAGQFNPGTEEGDHLIAHELAHGNQQRSRGSSAVAKKDLKVTRPGSPDELAADRPADEVVSQLHPQPPPQEGATTESSGPTPAVPQVAAPGGPTAGLAESGGAPAAPTSAVPELGQSGGNAPATRSGGTSSSGGGPSVGAFVVDQRPTVGQAPTCVGVGRTPDGIVDYYMETHWDPKEFHGIAKGVGYPGDLSTERVSTVDRLMPADTSPETRAVINVACSVASGFLDEYLINQAGEYLGIGGDFLKNLLDVGEGISNYVDLEDPVGLAMFGGMTVLDGVIGGLDSFLDDMTTQLGYLGALAKGLGGAVVVLSAVPVAIGTAVANAAGFATVGALVAAIDGIIVGLNAAIEMVRMPLKAAQSLVDIFQSGLDVVQFMYNEYAAGQAEQSGRFDKAGRYRDLMRGNTFDAMTDWLNGTANALLMIPLATELKLVGTIAINLVTSGPSLDMATWQGPTIDGTVGGMEIIADAISDTTVANDFLSEVGALQSDVPVVGRIGPNPGGLADPMRVDPEGMGRHYVERRAWQGPGALSAARQRTMDWLTTDYESVRADDPKWYQALINDIARPDDGANYKEATSPSYWIGQLLQGMPQLAEFVTDTSLEGIAVGCEAAAAVLPAAQPVFDSIALMVVEMKPQLQLVLEQVNAYVQEHDLDLSRLEAFTADLEGGLADLRGMLDPADELEAVAGAMIGTLEGMRVDPSRFDLPSWAPVDLVESAIAPLNSAIDAAIERIHSMQASIVEMWQTHVEGIILAVEGQVAAFRAQISEGGAFRTELQAQVDAFKASVASATEALAAWDGVLTLDARAGADYLTSVAAAARAAAAEGSAAESEGDPWQQILCDTAQPAVDAWRARHATEVETQYRPPVPQWEIDACGELYEEAMADPAISSSDRAEIDAAYQACIALTGREGREALYQLWAAEEALVAAIRAAG